jgi:hypothetical protein
MPAPRQTVPFTSPKVLIGEGKDEVNFFTALLAHLQLTDFQVEEYGGKGNLTKYLREFSVRPGRQQVVALAITRDADGDVGQVFQSIGTLLTYNQLPAPSAAGQIIAGSPRVGVFILPDNRRPGTLEDLCLDAVQGDGAMKCVQDYFNCVIQNTPRHPKPIAKAQLHAWLASQVDPDLRLGEAALRGIWPWSAQAFQPLIQFLQVL